MRATIAREKRMEIETCNSCTNLSSAGLRQEPGRVTLEIEAHVIRTHLDRRISHGILEMEKHQIARDRGRADFSNMRSLV